MGSGSEEDQSICSEAKRNDDMFMKKPIINSLVSQQRQGIKLNLRSLKFPTCLVIADVLPSVLWLIDMSFSVSNLLLYVEESVLSLDSVMHLWKSKVTCVNESQALELMAQHTVCKIGMGSVEFLWKFWCKKCGIGALVGVIFICYPNRFRKGEFSSCSIRWIRVNHLKVGGLTKTQWMIGIPASCDMNIVKEIISNASFERSLHSILNEGEHGYVCQAPNQVQREELQFWNSGMHKKMIVPSYKSRTGWVSRHLTLLEKALCLDVSELVIKKSIIVSSCPTEVIHSIEAGKMIPLKITQIAVNAIFDFWSSPRSFPVESRYDKNKRTISTCHANEKSAFQSDKEELYSKFEKEYLTNYGQKAAKNDDEAVPIELWDRYILKDCFDWLDYSTKVASALNIIREKFAFKWYLNRLRNSLFTYLRVNYTKTWYKLISAETSYSKKWGGKRKRDWEVHQDILINLKLDLNVARDAMTRACFSNWWNWSAGSSCFFWRWSKDIQKAVRDGFPVHIEKALPKYRQKQVFHLKEPELIQLKKKISKVVERGYLESGYVSSLINYFAVPKGEGDIRVVYDGTKCGLNESVWSPNFYLPSVDSLLMRVSTSTWFSDMDLGEMFLNYYLDKKLRPYAGVDISQLEDTDNITKKWVRWNRTLMGFRSSPYLACKLFGWTTDVIRGNRLDVTNPFHWDHIRINLPGDPDYDPTLPWIAKMSFYHEASDIIVYVDDIRPFASSKNRCRAAGKKASKITQHMGEQDASRKVRPPDQEPGPWCGSFVSIKNGCVWAYVSQKKWDKGRNYITNWIQQLLSCEHNGTVGMLEHKHLEQGRGFLVYLSRTYTTIVPYLKGIHLTLDSWRQGRDEDGWKLKLNGRRLFEDDDIRSAHLESSDRNTTRSNNSNSKAPTFVLSVPRLKNDLQALQLFFKPEKPPWRFVRGRKILVATYGFGDASKSGFGSTLQMENGISYRYGTWGSDGAEKSSNFRELENLAQALENEVSTTSLTGKEVFIFTDNSTAEGAYYKGTSSSKLLFEIVLRLKKLEFLAGFKIHFIHVAGSRMIEQGTDGLSRGDFGEGVMKGKDIMSFIPLHKTAIQRSDSLKHWIIDWIQPVIKGKEKIEFLSEADWFYRGHDIFNGSKNKEGIWMPNYKKGIFVWSPAPASGQFAVEQLREARNKRTASLHVFIIPRLFTSLWRRQLHRVSDLCFDLPFIENVWDKHSQHEPLTLAFIFPFLDVAPWQLKRAPAILEMGRLLPQMWKDSSVSTGFILCKLLLKARSLESMSHGVVRGVLSSARRFGIFHNESRE